MWMYLDTHVREAQTGTHTAPMRACFRHKSPMAGDRRNAISIFSPASLESTKAQSHKMSLQQTTSSLWRGKNQLPTSTPRRPSTKLWGRDFWPGADKTLGLRSPPQNCRNLGKFWQGGDWTRAALPFRSGGRRGKLGGRICRGKGEKSLSQLLR